MGFSEVDRGKIIEKCENSEGNETKCFAYRQMDKQSETKELAPFRIV